MKGKTHSGFVLWLMGPSASGKTTVAALLTKLLKDYGKPVLHYDGDEIRDFFGSNLGFRSSERLKVVSTLVHLANKASICNINVVVSALTANEDARELVHRELSPLIVYLSCSIETCAQRDPKGLYAMAKDGSIDTLIGFNSKYLPPLNPDFTVDTETLKPDQAAMRIVEFLRAEGYL